MKRNSVNMQITGTDKAETEKKKNNRRSLEKASVGMALMDAVPVICFCVTILLIGTIFGSSVFLMGGVLCTLAGAGKALWKLVLAVSGKSVPVLVKYFRPGMIGGFLLILLSLITDHRKISWPAVWKNLTWFPGNIMIIISILCLVLMGILAVRMDQSSAKANWLEQSVNCVAQFSLLMAVVLMWYGSGYFRAGEVARSACESSSQVAVTESDGVVCFDGPGTGTALVFYPGAKVEYTAYAPLMRQLAENGVDCFIQEMPYQMALFGIGSMDRIMETRTEYEHWYLAGHSLGGAMGSMYAADHSDQLEGLILLGAYPAKDLKDSGMKVLAIYGSEDQVLSREKLEEGRQIVPDSYVEFCIEGGNHAGFGDYGVQPGDGTADITPEEQWNVTTGQILSLIGNTV